MRPYTFVSRGESPGDPWHLQGGPDWCTTGIGGTAASSGRAVPHSALRPSNSERKLKPQFEDFFYQASLFGGSGFFFASRGLRCRFPFGSCGVPLLPDYLAEGIEIGERRYTTSTV